MSWSDSSARRSENPDLCPMEATPPAPAGVEIMPMKQKGISLGQSGYPTPEQAALASYSPCAGAFVVQVMKSGRFAEVEIDTNPSHPYFVTCVNGRYGLWYERGGHS
jgi:hypothetical protein